MPSEQGANKYIDLTDFSAGIHDSYHSIVGEQESQLGSRDGLARIDGTYGCYGRSGGGLFPLFGVVDRFIEDIPQLIEDLEIEAPDSFAGEEGEGTPSETTSLNTAAWVSTGSPTGYFTVTASSSTPLMCDETDIITVDTYPAGDPQPDPTNPLPDDDDPGWVNTPFGSDIPLPINFSTPTNDSPTGTLNLQIIRYSIRELDGTLVGYLYTQATENGEKSTWPQYWAWRPVVGTFVDFDLTPGTFDITPGTTAYEHMQYVLGTGVVSGFLDYNGSEDVGVPGEPGDRLVILQSWIDTNGADADHYRRSYGTRVYSPYIPAVRDMDVKRYGLLADGPYDSEAAWPPDPLDIPLGDESFGMGFVAIGRAASFTDGPTGPVSSPFFALGMGGVETTQFSYGNFPYSAIARYPGVTVAEGGLPATDKTYDFQWDQFEDDIEPIIQYRDRMDALVFHQGRMALGIQFFRLVAGDMFFSHDAFNYSPVNEGANWGWRSTVNGVANGNYAPHNTSTDIGISSPTYRVSQYGSLRPSAVGSVCSMNANQLLVVKRVGGAYIVQGDMASPTITDMPSVASTLDDPNIGVPTPFGFVYGSTSGVWAWGGSDGSELLSPQFDSCFWRHDMVRRANSNQARGKFNFLHPWILAPNGYMFNVLTKSWWRLERPDRELVDGENTYIVRSPAWYEVNDQGQIYAIPPYLTATSPVAWELYDPLTEQHEFQWTSQPIVRTRSRKLKFREYVLSAQGHGYVIVSLLVDGSAVATQTFTVLPGDPIVQRKPMSVQGEDVSVRIRSVGIDDDTPAPVVHRVSIGYHEAQSIGSVSTG